MERSANSLALAKGDTTIADQARHSFLFRLPFEVRLQIYSYVFSKTILHVEAVHPYEIKDNGIMVLPELEHQSSDEKETLDQLDCGRLPKPDEIHLLPNKPVVRSLGLGTGVSSSGLFTLYRCTSGKSFESASACPPGYCDHVDCGKIREGPAHALPRTCRKAYLEISDHVPAFKSYAALQFASLRDLMAFSMLLSDDVRENIRDLRVNLDFDFARPLRQWSEWHYFCNVFATPWDRRSIQYLFGNDYPNHKAEIGFYYNYSPHDLSMNDPDKAYAASWVTPNVHLEWELHNSSWGMAAELEELRARAPLSVRFAIPQFLFRTEDGEIDSGVEYMAHQPTQSHLYAGDDGYIRYAQRRLLATEEMEDLLAEKRNVLASVTREEKETFQDAYDKKFHFHWHEPHFRQLDWGSSWLRPLRHCQHFESFDIDFYDEGGPLSSVALEVLRDGLKERFTSLGIGPHPFLLYTH